MLTEKLLNDKIPKMPERTGALINVAELGPKLVCGQEILVRTRTIRQQGVGNVDKNGRRCIDQVHDYYLAVLSGVNVVVTRKGLKIPPRLVFETRGHAQIRASWEFLREPMYLPARPLSVPLNSVVTLGTEAINEWANRSAYDEEMSDHLHKLLNGEEIPLSLVASMQKAQSPLTVDPGK